MQVVQSCQLSIARAQAVSRKGSCNRMAWPDWDDRKHIGGTGQTTNV